MSDTEKKIIIDEDWKSQVAAEKEALSQKETAAETASFPSLPASFEMLVSVLATEAMVTLGQLPRPDGKEGVADCNQAKFFIDLLGVLQEKTKGNLTPQEAAGLEKLLHELRMVFVAVKNYVPPASSSPGSP